MTKYILGVIAAAAIMVACKKHEKEEDTTKPVIVIHSPAQDQNFELGDTITFSATITDNDELHELHVHVHNETLDEHILEQDYHLDAATYPFTFTHIVTEADSTEFHFEVTASDHNENSSFNEVECTANFNP